MIQGATGQLVSVVVRAYWPGAALVGTTPGGPAIALFAGTIVIGLLILAASSAVRRRADPRSIPKGPRI
jgi:hypothetical protein